jgi:3-hydroxyacyl-[acyl-carrier-protein] dehydratase
MPLVIDPSLEQADTLDVKRLIPHRYPFLMIDRVANIAAGVSAVGIKCVTNNEPHFEGHFPSRPVMPGVLIVEAMAQTAAVLVMKTLKVADHDLLVYFMSIDRARFRHPVVPGDVLELHVAIQRGRSKVWRFTGVGRVGDTDCAEAEFMAMIMSPEDLESKG